MSRTYGNGICGLKSIIKDMTKSLFNFFVRVLTRILKTGFINK